MKCKNTSPRNKEIIERFGLKHTQAAHAFRCNPQSCENPTYYEDYLKYNAFIDGNNGMGLTFVFCEYEGEELQAIKGFITLKASSVVTMDEEGAVEGFPAMEISELAVSAEFEGQKIGTALLCYAVTIAKEVSENYFGIQYISACADPAAVGFYEKVLGMTKVRDSFDIPRERWNVDCIPLLLRIGEY